MAMAVSQSLLKSDKKTGPTHINDANDASTSPAVKSANASFANNQIKMMPSLPMKVYQPNSNLLIAFDTRTKNPAFVMEHLSPKSINANDKASRKNKRFYEEQSLPPYLRSRAHHYKNSGFDRGHLAPAADFPEDDEMEDTFCLTNVSPQYAKLNRGMWLRLEDFVRNVVRSATDEDVWVVTGPLWLPNTVKKNSSGEDEFGYVYEGIGKLPSLVSVPSHFFKVIVVVDRPNTQSTRLKKFAAFVLPNDDLVEKEKDCLLNYTVRITDLEAVSGLEFFPTLMGAFIDNPDDTLPLDKVIADALTDDLRYNASNARTVKSSADNSTALAPLTNTKELSKGRLRKIKQILRDNQFTYEHLCKGNAGCFKMFNV